MGETTVQPISVSSCCTVHLKFQRARQVKDPLYTNEKAGFDIKDVESHLSFLCQFIQLICEEIQSVGYEKFI